MSLDSRIKRKITDPATTMIEIIDKTPGRRSGVV